MTTVHTSRAAVLVNPNEPLQLVELILPPLLPGQVRVKLEASGICATQLMEVMGQKGPDRFLPHTLGHEGVGLVEEVGASVTKVRPGERVALTWLKGKGSDVPATRYESSLGPVNSGAVSTLLTRTIVSENRVVPIRGAISAEEGVLLGCALPTGGGTILNSGLVTSESVVAIFGLGGIGLAALITAASLPVKKIFAIDPMEKKRALAVELGAHVTIDPIEQNVVRRILDATDQRGVDVAVEASGKVTSIESAFGAVRDKGGTAIIVSNVAHGEKIALDPFLFIRGKRLIGSWGGESDPDRDIPRFLSLYDEGRLPLKKLISPSYPLNDVQRAFDDLRTGQLLRPVITF